MGFARGGFCFGRCKGKTTLEIPEKVVLGQLKDVVVKYLNEDPEERHLHEPESAF
jgi:hypothetical protein